jgi:phosphoserine aminotransferase
VLPEKVIKGARQAILEIPGTGISALVVNHRSQLCLDIVNEAKKNIIDLLTIPENYNIIFLQGGASLQFTMIPKNLWHDKNRPVEYILTGYWSKKAIHEAYFEGEKVNIAWDGSSSNLSRIPTLEECNIHCNASYIHYCSNESVEGLQFQEPLEVGEIPLVCDMSSDLITKPIEISKYALVYAHSQKNLGAAGVTVVIIRNDLLQYVPNNIPTMLDYRSHVKNNSIYNTPPTFGVYLILLVTRWLLNDIGGLTNMDKINKNKAKLLYDMIDNSKGFYRGHARINNR